MDYNFFGLEKSLFRFVFVFFFIDRRMLEIAQFFYDGEKFAYFILQIQLLNFFLMML